MHIIVPMKRLWQWAEVSLWGEPVKRRRRAARLASLLLNELNRLGFTKKIAQARGKTRVQRVQFSYPLLLTTEEVWCPLDTAQLPIGVRTDDLREPDVQKSLAERCNTDVWMDRLARGLWHSGLRQPSQPIMLKLCIFRL